MRQTTKRRPLRRILCWTMILTSLGIVLTIYAATCRLPRARSLRTDDGPKPSGSVKLSPTTAVWNLDSLVDKFVDWPSGCETGRDDATVVLILVTSAPHHFDRRQAIRETWGSIAAAADSRSSLSRSRTVFLVGRPTTDDAVAFLLDNEMSRHGDVLLGDYVDTYRNLTLKVISFEIIKLFIVSIN